MQAPKCLYIRIILSTLYSYSNQPNNYFYTQIGLQFRQDQLSNQKQYIYITYFSFFSFFYIYIKITQLFIIYKIINKNMDLKVRDIGSKI